MRPERGGGAGTRLGPGAAAGPQRRRRRPPRTGRPRPARSGTRTRHPSLSPPHGAFLKALRALPGACWRERKRSCPGRRMRRTSRWPRSRRRWVRGSRSERGGRGRAGSAASRTLSRGPPGIPPRGCGLRARRAEPPGPAGCKAPLLGLAGGWEAAEGGVCLCRYKCVRVRVQVYACVCADIRVCMCIHAHLRVFV